MQILCIIYQTVILIPTCLRTPIGDYQACRILCITYLFLRLPMTDAITLCLLTQDSKLRRSIPEHILNPVCLRRCQDIPASMNIRMNPRRFIQLTQLMQLIQLTQLIQFIQFIQLTQFMQLMQLIQLIQKHIQPNQPSQFVQIVFINLPILFIKIMTVIPRVENLVQFHAHQGEPILLHLISKAIVHQFLKRKNRLRIDRICHKRRLSKTFGEFSVSLITSQFGEHVSVQ